ncbi:MAG: dipeptide epimerase [Hyphomicrobium sp. 32-62-53]|nr:MAG: dipeptide epimerase [Hyphomicrobium sp. 12-62-95]OYX99058.1 MAG: dipeptide epimerase [Hyphomicrobium sp. 32-62-53]
MTDRTIRVAIESWPLAQPFVIARGAKTEARVIVVTLSQGGVEGRGECVPYARYGETAEATAAAIEAAGAPASHGDLARLLPPGAARNALDCALFDLEAKLAGVPVAQLMKRPEPGARETCFTLSLDTPEAMAEAARQVPQLKLLKLKLGGAGDDERMRMVRAARPDARLVGDANEAWTVELLDPLLAVAAECRFETIEQPLPADDDGALGTRDRPLPICADESAHVASDITALVDRYDAVNIKLDKAGGLTEALAMADAARAAGLDIMAGSMVSTSLGVAPAMLVAQYARWVDLDGPLLLAKDREPGIVIHDGIIEPAQRGLWG